MSANPETARPQGLAAIAENLLATLQQEEDALERLHACFDAQFEALRRHEHAVIEEQTVAVNEVVHAMDGYRQARERQARLLARLLRLEGEGASLEALIEALAARPDTTEVADRLRAARTRIHEQAQRTRTRCEEYEFALQYAVKLGREMLQVIQDLDVPPPARVYTATGGAAQTTTPRSVLNKVG